MVQNKIKAFLGKLSSKQIQSLLACVTFIVMSIVLQSKIMDHWGSLMYKLIYGFFCVICIASAVTGIYGTLRLKKKWLPHHLFFTIVYFALDGIHDYRFLDDFAGKFAILIIMFGPVFILYCDIIRQEEILHSLPVPEPVIKEPAPPYSLYDQQKY